MSFGFHFVATTRVAALHHLGEMRKAREDGGSMIPFEVIAYCEEAVRHLQHEGYVEVNAYGHLCAADSNSYQVSSLTIEVKPIVADVDGVPAAMPASGA